MAVKTKKKTSAEYKHTLSIRILTYEVSNVNDAEHVNC